MKGRTRQYIFNIYNTYIIWSKRCHQMEYICATHRLYHLLHPVHGRTHPHLCSCFPILSSPYCFTSMSATIRNTLYITISCFLCIIIVYVQYIFHLFYFRLDAFLFSFYISVCVFFTFFSYLLPAWRPFKLKTFSPKSIQGDYFQMYETSMRQT